MNFRVGLGYDVHQLVKGRKLIIGGAEIPFAKGLLGHSDADVLLHSVSDALLGAVGLGDIGKHFPDTDPKYKDACSQMLLEEVVDKLDKEKWQINNIDAVIMAQKPKMAPHIEKMRENIAKCCKIDKEFVNVKATTTEKLGFVGREEGIATQVVVSVVKL